MTRQAPSLSEFFMEAAHELLSSEHYDAVHAEAVRKSREATLKTLGHLPKAAVAVDRDATDVGEAANGSTAKSGKAPMAVPLNVVAVEKSHGVQRMADRFALRLEDADLQQLKEMVEGDAVMGVQLVRREMQSIAILDVPYKGVEVRVVWNETQGRLITAYPKRVNKRKQKKHAPPRKKIGAPKRMTKKELLQLSLSDEE